MFKSVIRVGFIALAIGTLESLRRQLAKTPGAASGIDVPHEETTWEGEGGSLPMTGSHLGPEPVFPQTAYSETH